MQAQSINRSINQPHVQSIKAIIGPGRLLTADK